MAPRGTRSAPPGRRSATGTSGVGRGWHEGHVSEGGASRLRSPFTKHCEATAALSTGPAPQEPGPILAIQTKAPPPPRSGPAPRPTPGPLPGNVAAALEKWHSGPRSLDRCPCPPRGCTREPGSVWTAGARARCIPEPRAARCWGLEVMQDPIRIQVTSYSGPQDPCSPH
ncbi:uncharacterized protein LOC143274515 [Peromyscus maniculatus bairdii]|uniref:uncharacterized protein LOC143274515 n=1 Tax=Peromyscus maniculatus bairdii TaxID=230844 RepID=UPI003FD145A2